MENKKITIGQIILFLLLLLYTLFCFLPIVLVAIASFTDGGELALNGFSFFPEKWSLDGWRYVWELKDQIINSYGITIFITVMHTVATLLVESMLAFALSRKSFKLRGIFSIMLLLTTLFSGGMLSSYIFNTSIYHLKDTMLILWLPAVSMTNTIILRTYISGTISDAVVESAKIDGARDFRIFFQIVLPLMKPSLASIGFMTAVGKWNNWVTGQMYISTPEKRPLQNILMAIENNIQAMMDSDMSMEMMESMEGAIPEDSARMALLFAVLGPIMIIYPFFQKYFVKGLTLGSVKG
ncbi:MAG: carbohydrate ABC transporter permease [Lachnospiraceae bacterium]|nr:carbohydrate ABC transporter permease [Lachnospiraceae bacterium]MBQ8245644.1 carbohydrate ABC transporter permease [Lachnospiraceae bacterium]